MNGECVVIGIAMGKRNSPLSAMAEIHSPATPGAGLPAIPDDVTLPQFVLDAALHPTRPIRMDNSPWLIQDESGSKFGFEEVSFQHNRRFTLTCISCALVLLV